MAEAERRVLEERVLRLRTEKELCEERVLRLQAEKELAENKIDVMEREKLENDLAKTIAKIKVLQSAFNRRRRRLPWLWRKQLCDDLWMKVLDCLDDD